MEFAPLLHLALALAGAPLLPSIAQRVKARFAGRQGAPLLQPYYDLARLLRKGAVYSTTTSWPFRLGPVVSLAAAVTALMLVPFGHAAAVIAFPGDLVLFAYLLGLMRAVTVLAALDTGSAFEGMGASREAAFGALAEPVLLLSLAALARESGAISLSAIRGLWAGSDPALVLVLGALAALFLVENARMPIDDPNTHLELTMIHEVMVLDHGGPDLAFIEYAAAIKQWVLATLVVGVAVPQAGFAPWTAFALALVGILLVAIAAGVVESVTARLRLDAVPQFLVGAGALSAVALLLGLR